MALNFCSFLKALFALPDNNDSFAFSNPSFGLQSVTVAIAIAALAQTTLFWASLPFPSKTFVKMVADNGILDPPLISSAFKEWIPKSDASIINSPLFLIAFVDPVREISS